MNEYKKYRRKQVAELAAWSPNIDMAGVSISEADLKTGSPKLGDMIARNPKNHQDRWLIAADYFMDNFEPVNQGIKVICICGSTKFTPEMLQLSWEYAKVGILALGWFVRPTRKGEPEHHLAELEGVAEKLDELHLRKIDFSDEVFVLNIGGYIGESTHREIEYAMQTGKAVKYFEPMPTGGNKG